MLSHCLYQYYEQMMYTQKREKSSFVAEIAFFHVPFYHNILLQILDVDIVEVIDFDQFFELKLTK